MLNIINSIETDGSPGRNDISGLIQSNEPKLTEKTYKEGMYIRNILRNVGSNGRQGRRRDGVTRYRRYAADGNPGCCGTTSGRSERQKRGTMPFAASIRPTR